MQKKIFRSGIQQSFHLSFWPYAAACKLYDDWQRDDQSGWRFLSSVTRDLPYASRLHHPDWQEPILMLATLMAEKNQLDNLIDRLLHKRDKEERYLHQNLRLAAAIIGEVGTGNLDEKHEQKVIRQLGHLARNYSKVRSMLAVGLLFALPIGLFTSGILVFYHYLPLLYFGVLALFWVIFWVFSLLPWGIRLPRILNIPRNVLRIIIRNAYRTVTNILRSIGLESAHPHIFVTTLSSAGKAAIPELVHIFESCQQAEDELSYEVVHAMGNTGSKEAVPFLSDIMNSRVVNLNLTKRTNRAWVNKRANVQYLYKASE